MTTDKASAADVLRNLALPTKQILSWRGMQEELRNIAAELDRASPPPPAPGPEMDWCRCGLTDGKCPCTTPEKLARRAPPPAPDDELVAVCAELGCTTAPGVALRFTKELRRDLGRAYERHIELLRTWDTATPTERQELDRLRRGWGPSTPTERMARRTDLIAAMNSISKAMDTVLPDDKAEDVFTRDDFQAAYDRLSTTYHEIIALLQALPQLTDPDVEPTSTTPDDAMLREILWKCRGEAKGWETNRTALTENGQNYLREDIVITAMRRVASHQPAQRGRN